MIKRLVITFIAVLSLVCTLPAADKAQEKQSAAASRYMTSVSSFLTKEGYDVVKLANGFTFSFKKDNIKYFVTVDKEAPVYTSMECYLTDLPDADEYHYLRAVNRINSVYCAVKAIYHPQDKEVVLCVDGYTQSADEFRATFRQNIEVLESCYKTFATTMSETASAPKGKTSAKNKPNQPQPQAHKQTIDMEQKQEQNQSKPNEQVKQESPEASTDTSVAEEPLEFLSATVANCDGENSILSDFGRTIYAYRSRFLEPKLSLRVNTPGVYKFYVKLITPDGKLSTAEGSPKGYTFVDKQTLAQGTQDVVLSAWGKNVAGNWPAGNYRFEFYLDDTLLGSLPFTIH